MKNSVFPAIALALLAQPLQAQEAEPGQAGTSNAAVVSPVVGGMNAETPAV
jgi:hypothetical protein